MLVVVVVGVVVVVVVLAARRHGVCECDFLKVSVMGVMVLYAVSFEEVLSCFVSWVVCAVFPGADRALAYSGRWGHSAPGHQRKFIAVWCVLCNVVTGAMATDGSNQCEMFAGDGGVSGAAKHVRCHGIRKARRLPVTSTVTCRLQTEVRDHELHLA